VTTGAGADWVPNHASGSVSRIDPATNKVVATVRDVGTPAGIGFTAGAVWVVDDFHTQVSRIDPATNKVTASAPTGEGASWLAWDAKNVWVSNTKAGTVTQVDAATTRVVRTVKTGPAPLDGDVVAGGAWFPTTDGSLVRVDVRTGAVQRAKLPIGQGFVVGTAGGAVWVADFGGTDVVRVAATGLAGIAPYTPPAQMGV
jgi:virginiamycin B lyase